MTTLANVALALLLAAAPKAAPKPKLEVPGISEEWLARAAACEAKAPGQPTEGQSMAQAIERADAADKAFTDEMAVSCGFVSREQHDRFRVRIAAAVSEVMAPMALTQLGGLKPDEFAVVDKGWKRKVKEGSMTPQMYAFLKAEHEQTLAAGKVYKAWGARKPGSLKHLNVELVLLGLRKPSHAATADVMIAEKKLNAAQKAKFLADMEAAAKRTEAWAKEQPPLNPVEVTVMGGWLQKNNLATQKAAGQ